MRSKGRRIAKSIGKSIKKKFEVDFCQFPFSLDEQQRDLFYLPAHTFNTTLYSGSPLTSQKQTEYKMSVHSPKKSSSLGTITSDPTGPDFVDHEEIIALTHDVKKFSDSLARLKQLFTEGIDPEEDARVVIHEGLGEVLSVLNPVMQHYSALQSPDIFTAARNLITMIKDHDYEGEMTSLNIRDFCDAIDQLALNFSSSVSEYLMGDMGPQLVMDLKTKSMNNVSVEEVGEPHEESEIVSMSPEEIDSILVSLDKGLTLALQRAKVWSKYIGDIITYIDRKTQLELDYAKNLSRLANAVQNSLKKEAFLPLQSTYCTALTQDVEYASNLQATQAVLHSHKFVEPLSLRRTDHDKVYKSVKEAWHRECRKMNDSVTNLRKAYSLYMSRQQDHERAHDLALKADGEKQDKRRKAEDDAMHKAAEAETTYKACVAEANYRQQELFKVKNELLAKIREQIQLCDQVIKEVTMEYFKLYNTVMSPLPLQYQTLSESSKSYQPGSQYAEYVRRLPGTNRACQPETFLFEPYVQGQKSSSDTRKESFHSNGSVSDTVHSPEGSPVTSSRRDKYRIPVKAWGQQMQSTGTSDTDSASCSSKSHESSPSGSPHRATRRHLASSQSLDEVTEEELLAAAARNGQDMKGLVMKRTVAVAGGDNLDLPGLLMLHRGRRNTTFGVDFQEQVDNFQTKVPPIVSKCLSEIDKRGVMIKGIYRVSGVKSKVEHLCQRFDIDPESVDLENVHPNIISNVLKLYLRQLPEPLLTFRLYSDFIHAAKENMSGHLFGEHLLEQLKRLISRLPSSHLSTCAVLMHHLHRVASHSELNQMSFSNLGIVFGPTLLRPMEGSASLASLVDTPHQTRAIELLITHAPLLFGPVEDFPTIPIQTPVEQLNKALSGVLLPGQGFKPQGTTTPQKPKVSQASIESDDTSLPVFESPSNTPGASSGQPSACEFLLPGTASQGRNETLSLASSDVELEGSQDDDIDDLFDIHLPDQSKPLTNPLYMALSPQCIEAGQDISHTVRAGSTSITTTSPSADHLNLPYPMSSAHLSPSLSVPNMGSGSDMAATLSASMSGMAAALMMSSASFTSFEVPSGFDHTALPLLESMTTDWTTTSRSPQAVQESVASSAVKTSDDVSHSQKVGTEELSKKKLHSQQLQNIKYLTQAPAGEENSSDFFLKEIPALVQVESSTTQRPTGLPEPRLAATSGKTFTKTPSAPDVLETMTEGMKEEKVTITFPESVHEPSISSPYMSKISSSRRSVLEEMPIPTVSRPFTAADGSRQDNEAVPSVTIPASPTIKRREVPSKIPTSPSAQRCADAKHAGEKLDNRADKFRQEQRKLVKAIKSDALIGSVVLPPEVVGTPANREHGRDLNLSLSWEQKRSSEVFENVVSGGCALSSRPSSQSEEAGENDANRREGWRGESTPSPDETDADACKSIKSAGQTSSSVTSQESSFPQSPVRSSSSRSETSKSSSQISPRQRTLSSGGTTSARARPINVPSTSMVKKPVSLSPPSSATKVVGSSVSKAATTTTQVARTTSSSLAVVSPRSSLQGRSQLTKPTSTTEVIKHAPSPSSTDQSLKMCPKAGGISKTLEDTSASSKSSPITRKSSGRGGELSSLPKVTTVSVEVSSRTESPLRPDDSSTERSSTSSSQSSSPRHGHNSGEASSSHASQSTKSSHRKPTATVNPTGSPRKIHERCQLEKSVSFVPRSGSQQGSSMPKLVSPRPSQLPSSVAPVSSSSSPPSTPTSASGKLSQDRTPRFV